MDETAVLYKVSSFHLRIMLLQETVEAIEQVRDDTLPPIANLLRWGFICASVITSHRDVIHSLKLNDETYHIADQSCLVLAVSCLAVLEQTRVCMKAKEEAPNTDWVFDHFKMHMARVEFERIIDDPELLHGLGRYVDQSMIDDLTKMLDTEDDTQISIAALFKISDAVSSKLEANFMFRHTKAASGKLH